MDSTTTTTIQCFHCGEDCDDQIIRKDDHAFCCQGCSTVYQLIQSADLDGYYQFNATPGTKSESKISQQFIDALSVPEIVDELVVFQQDGFCRIAFTIPAIHCSSCVWLLEKLPELLPGVHRSTVNFTTRVLNVNFNPDKVALKDLVLLLDQLGYRPLLDVNRSAKKTASTQRKMLIRLAVAGFCFGNIMLLYFPHYFGDLELTNPAHSEFFKYLSLILSLPVLIYSAQPFLKGGWTSLKTKSLNIDVPISLGILVLFIRSLVEVVWLGSTGYLDSLAGLVFFLLLGRWYQQRTYDALSFERDAGAYMPLAAVRLEGEEKTVIPVQKIQAGDLLEIRSGDIIPTDGVVVKGVGGLDYAFVTGESDEVRVKKGERVYAGGIHHGVPFEMEATSTYDAGYLVQLWDESTQKRNQREGMSTLLNRLSRYFTLAVLIIASVSFLAWAWVDLATAFDAFTAVLIVACPCALALSAPFVLGTVMRFMGKSGLFLKSSHLVETMAAVTDVVFDKTGTLTASGKTTAVWVGEDLTADEWDQVIALAKMSSHPKSRAIVKEYSATRSVEFKTIHELPGQGVKGDANGEVKIGSAPFVGAKEVDASVAFVKIDDEVKGYFKYRHSLRKGWLDAVQRLKIRISPHLLSGDKADEDLESTGAFSDSMSIYRCKPEDKSGYINALQCRGKVVLMAGDGINDIPALQQSDMGVAVTDAEFHFTPAADAIVHGDALLKMPEFLAYAVSGRRLIMVCIVLSLLYNVVGLWFAISGNLSPVFAAILMPLSSISVVGLATAGSWWLSRKHLS